MSLFIPLVRPDFPTSGTSINELNPFLDKFERKEIKVTLGTFLILKTYINKIKRLMELEHPPDGQAEVFNRLRIEELRESRQVSRLVYFYFDG